MQGAQLQQVSVSFSLECLNLDKMNTRYEQNLCVLLIFSLLENRTTKLTTCFYGSRDKPRRKYTYNNNID